MWQAFHIISFQMQAHIISTIFATIVVVITIKYYNCKILIYRNRCFGVLYRHKNDIVFYFYRCTHLAIIKIRWLLANIQYIETAHKRYGFHFLCDFNFFSLPKEQKTASIHLKICIEEIELIGLKLFRVQFSYEFLGVNTDSII